MEDYEFYHTDNGKFTNDALMPIDGIFDFNEFMEQQTLIDLLEHYEHYKATSLFIPDYLEGYFVRVYP